MPMHGVPPWKARGSLTGTGHSQKAMMRSLKARMWRRERPRHLTRTLTSQLAQRQRQCLQQLASSALVTCGEACGRPKTASG